MKHSHKDNRIILDLAKCQWSRFYYRNQWGQTTNTKPTLATYRAAVVNPFELAQFHPEFPGETLLERIKRRGELDVWTPEVAFKLSASGVIIYTGPKAVVMNKAWGERIFKKNKTKSL